MNRTFPLLSLALIFLLAFSACKQMPDHARYIPKDAVAVVGINTKELGKKVAWSMIAGSELLDELAKDDKKGLVRDLEQAGVEGRSTTYLYFSPDKRYGSKYKMVALIPLADAGKWEAYLKQKSPEATIKAGDKRSEASLNDMMYASWSKDLLMISSVISNETASMHYEYADSTNTVVIDSYSVSSYTPDPTAMTAEMEANFALKKENALVSDNRFTRLEKAGHDITFWVNYDRLMGEVSKNNGMGMMGGFSDKLWKNSAMTAGLDFEQGRIAGDIEYFVPDKMKEVYKEMGNGKVDQKMLERLPGQNLNMVMGYSMSPKGLKMMLEKMGVMGLVNLGLSSMGVSADQILEGFSGDIVLSLNGTGQTQQDTSTPAFNFTLALKLNKKDNIQRLLDMLAQKGMIISKGGGVYESAEDNGPALVMDASYAVVANNAAQAQAYIDGSAAKTPLAEEARREVAGHSFGMFADFQAILNSIPAGTGRDSALSAEMRNLLLNASFNGGDFAGNSFKSRLKVELKDKKENSLVQLLGLAQRLKKARETYSTPDVSEVMPPDVEDADLMAADSIVEREGVE